MIGIVYAMTLNNTVYGTAHCPHRCLESSCCVSTQLTELTRKAATFQEVPKRVLSRLFPVSQSLKQHYTLLWDMSRNEGYINIVAVMQKFFDLAISGNWS